MVYRLNETTWLQDAGGGAEIFYFQNWAVHIIVRHVEHVVVRLLALHVVREVHQDVPPRAAGLLRLVGVYLKVRNKRIASK